MIGLTDSADVATARIMMGPFSCLPCACLPGAASAAAIAGAAAEAAAAAAGELGLHRCSAAGLTKRRCTVAMAHSVRSMTKNMQPTNTWSAFQPNATPARCTACIICLPADGLGGMHVGTTEAPMARVSAGAGCSCSLASLHTAAERPSQLCCCSKC
ncbi:hypothetical protein COO60DRAFT_1518686 [Scenedesmus sp. NREL 46B-D3]|nr:hypothetical protein COO60DRAFT_1518686 [Scenedesmus sp. NREL 46B-D3]